MKTLALALALSMGACAADAPEQTQEDDKLLVGSTLGIVALISQSVIAKTAITALTTVGITTLLRNTFGEKSTEEAVLAQFETAESRAAGLRQFRWMPKYFEATTALEACQLGTPGENTEVAGTPEDAQLIRAILETNADLIAAATVYVREIKGSRRPDEAAVTAFQTLLADATVGDYLNQSPEDELQATLLYGANSSGFRDQTAACWAHAEPLLKFVAAKFETEVMQPLRHNALKRKWAVSQLMLSAAEIATNGLQAVGFPTPVESVLAVPAL